MSKKNPLLNPPIRAIVKVHELILSFDTTQSNEDIQKQALELIDEINRLLAKSLKSTLPQLGRDSKRKPKISVIPVTPEELEEE